MGLDMYLKKRTYVKNWDHFSDDERHEVTVKKGGEIRDDIKPERVSEITEQVAYWRKANAIHKWFVDNVQKGNDDCGTYYVDRDQLKELVNVCKQVLGTVETVDGDVVVGKHIGPEDEDWVVDTKRGKVVAQAALARKLLPPQSGFFFGSTDVDEYYLQDLQETVRQVEPLLTEPGDGYFYYHASW